MIPHKIKLFGTTYPTKEIKDVMYRNRTMPDNKLAQKLNDVFVIPLINTTYKPKTREDILTIGGEDCLVYPIGIVNGGDAQFLTYYSVSKEMPSYHVKSYHVEIEPNKVTLYVPLIPYLEGEAQIEAANKTYAECLSYMSENLKRLAISCKVIAEQELERLKPIVEKQRANEKRRQGGH
jgi:hypothetical protein